MFIFNYSLNKIRITATAILFLFLSFSANSQNWQIIGEKIHTGKNLTGMTAGINGEIYIAYEDPGVNGWVSVKKFNGKHWQYVGTRGISEEKVQFISIVVDKKNIPHIAYCTGSNKLFIKKFSKEGWVQKGVFKISSGNSSNMALLFDKQNQLFLAFSDEEKQHLSVKKSENNKWEEAGINLPAGKSSGKFISIAVDTSNHIYLAYSDENNGGKVMVKKLQDNIWYPVGVFASENSVSDISFAIDNTNTPYVLYTETENEQINIKRYFRDDKGGKWLQAGNPDSIQHIRSSALAIHRDIPYVAYISDNELKGSIKKLDGTEWVSESKLNQLSTKKIHSISLLSDNRKNLYLLLHEANNSLTIMKRSVH